VLITLDTDFANPMRHPPGATPGIAVLRLPEPITPALIDTAVAVLLAELGREGDRRTLVDRRGRSNPRLRTRDLRQIMKAEITIEQAYPASFFFLERYFERGQSNEIAGLLGSMQLIGTMKTADPAQWEDWMDALQRALQPDALEKLRLTLRRGVRFENPQAGRATFQNPQRLRALRQRPSARFELRRVICSVMLLQ
jgi:hypothetical protein